MSTVELRYNDEVRSVVLSTPSQALMVKECVWARQAYSGPEAVLLVLASHPYDASSYITDPP